MYRRELQNAVVPLQLAGVVDTPHHERKKKTHTRHTRSSQQSVRTRSHYASARHIFERSKTVAEKRVRDAGGWRVQGDEDVGFFGVLSARARGVGVSTKEHTQATTRTAPRERLMNILMSGAHTTATRTRFWNKRSRRCRQENVCMDCMPGNW